MSSPLTTQAQRRLGDGGAAAQAADVPASRRSLQRLVEAVEKVMVSEIQTGKSGVELVNLFNAALQAL